MRVRINFGLSCLVALVMAFGFSCTSPSKAGPPAAKMESKVQKDTRWKFHAIVTVDYVQQYVKIPKPKDVVLIDSRPTRKKYNKGFIPTAINIPDSQFAKFVHLLPENKETLLIFYCQGST